MPLSFGLAPVKIHPSTLLLKDYLPKAGLPVPPAHQGYEYAVSDAVWAQSMLGNGPDTLPDFPSFQGCGDCVWAAFLHYIMAARANAGERVIFTAKDAVGLYSKYTGYDPSQTQPDGSNPTDNGTAMTDGFAAWQKDGLLGHKILGWAAINPSDPAQRKAAIYAFGATFSGISVTASMMQQFQNGQPWNSPFDGAMLGRHAFPILGFGRFGQTGLSWARRVASDPDFPQLISEEYVVVTQDWLDAQGKSPSGLDLQTLQSDLSAVTA
jgi:hypothetical protein